MPTARFEPPFEVSGHHHGERREVGTLEALLCPLQCSDALAQGVWLASTLGRADYRTNTAEDRSPSLVFQKFLSDAAHSVCGKVVSQDASRPAAERIFFLEAQASDTVASAPEAVEANIKQLLMRFHSRDVELGSDTLDAWMWMHESASFVSPNPQLAWNAVCVGLITHPDFYSY